MVVFDQKLLYSGKVVVLGQNGCARAKDDVNGQGGNTRAKWLYWRKGCCIHLAKVVVFGQKLLYSVNNYVIRAKRCCIRAEVVVFGMGG